MALVVPGVGLYNAASGLTSAYSRSTPVLLIAGQIPRAAIGKNLGAIHEIDNQPGVVSSVTKWQRMASRPREVPDAVFEAFRQMRTGRPRPVLIEMPPEAGVEREEVELRNPARISRIVPSPQGLREAAAVIGHSNLPLIYAGGGVARSDAERCGPKKKNAGERSSPRCTFHTPTANSRIHRMSLDTEILSALTSIDRLNTFAAGYPTPFGLDAIAPLGAGVETP